MNTGVRRVEGANIKKEDYIYPMRPVLSNKKFSLNKSNQFHSKNNS